MVKTAAAKHAAATWRTKANQTKPDDRGLQVDSLDIARLRMQFVRGRLGVRPPSRLQSRSAPMHELIQSALWQTA